MTSTIPHRHLWSPERLTSADLLALLNTAARLKQARPRDGGSGPLRGRHLALLCSTRSEVAPAFQRAVGELGGTVSLLNADQWRLRAGDRIADAARLLGRLYDAIDCCDLADDVVEQIEHSGVPVFNGLACSDHPMAWLGEFLTMREAVGKPLQLSRVDLAEHATPGAARPALAFARLAGMQVGQRHGAVPALAGGSAAVAGDAPDFVLDPSAGPAARLMKPQASAAQQAELNLRLAANRQCTLQAAIVCALQ